MQIYQEFEKSASKFRVGEVWSDLHQNLNLDASGAIKKVINMDAVRGSLDNIIRTSPFERVMRPDFACGFNDMLFESISRPAMDLAVQRIKTNVPKWDDRIIINDITFNLFPDNNRMDIVIVFSIRGYPDVFQQTFPFATGGAV